MVMGARPPYAWKEKRTNFLGWLLVEIIKKWCAVSSYPDPGVIWDRTNLAISQLLGMVERWNFFGVIWALNIRLWPVTMHKIANWKKLFQKNLKTVSSHPELRYLGRFLINNALCITASLMPYMLAVKYCSTRCRLDNGIPCTLPDKYYPTLRQINITSPVAK